MSGDHESWGHPPPGRGKRMFAFAADSGDIVAAGAEESGGGVIKLAIASMWHSENTWPVVPRASSERSA